MARGLLCHAGMCEFESLDRCAAYVAARAALDAVYAASARWPGDIAEQARASAVDAVMCCAESLRFDRVTAERRRYIRDAIGAALCLAATCDIARASGGADDATGAALRRAGRAIAVLGLFLHASTRDWDD